MGLKNNKALGQHWLQERGILELIAEEIVLRPGERVSACLEIGPGLGTLTTSLLKRAERVLAVEIDQRLARNLAQSFAGSRVQVINEDILVLDPRVLELPEEFVVAGNIPYYITTPIVMKILNWEHKPAKVVLLMQKEMAERIAMIEARSNLLGLFVKNLAEVTLGEIVGRDWFVPPPKVDSQVLILTPRKQPLYSQQIFQLVRPSFASPRKKLVNNLENAGYDREKICQSLAALGFDSNTRPADLQLEDYWQLLQILT